MNTLYHEVEQVVAGAHRLQIFMNSTFVTAHY